MATTLLLDRDGWGLALDASGNIALASEPYSQAQDVASACRLFQGEAFYDTTLGIPYFQSVLGQFQPVQVLRAALEAAAFSVPGVTSARVFLSDVSERSLSGQVQLGTADEQQVANF